MKGYSYKSKEKLNCQKDDYIFDKQYEKFLSETYNINQDDINELINTINNINFNNYLENYQCRIIDKLMKVENIKTYEKTMKEINKTKVETSISLHKNNMNIKQYMLL